MDYYVADSFKNLETIGGVFEKDGKEYINVVLKSGKVHAARVYRPKASTPAKPSHVIYNQRDALGFAPKGFIYVIKTENEEKLQNICHWHPAFGPYLKCTEDIFDLPFGCEIKKIYWIDVADDNLTRLLPNEIIKKKLSFENL